MKGKFLFVCLGWLVLGWLGVGRIIAVEATDSSKVVAAAEAETATPAGRVGEESVKPPDLTQPLESKSRLERVLDGQKVEGGWLTNFLTLGIRRAVDGGVPANTIVLLLLFPMVAVMVAFSRNIVGMNGFGIFTPAVVSVAFLATGITAGLILFAAILITATGARMLMRKVKLSYLPRMALLIWFVSLALLGLLIGAPVIKMSTLVNLGIFPILLFILLGETFIAAQITRTLNMAALMTVETLILALMAFFLMSSYWVQEVVLLHPEVTVLLILLADLMIGGYRGLRLLELWRFRKLLRD